MKLIDINIRDHQGEVSARTLVIDEDGIRVLGAIPHTHYIEFTEEILDELREALTGGKEA